MRSKLPGLAAGRWLLVFALPGFAGAGELSDYDQLYLRHRPPLGEAHVMDVSSEVFSRKVLAASLQGVVNRTKARLYLLDGQKGSNRPWETEGEYAAGRFWLRTYQERHGLKVAWEGNLEQALAIFAEEAEGYLLFAEHEPWTLNAATTLAGLHDWLIASPAEEAMLARLGLKKVEDLRGRWKDPGSCYRELHEAFYAQMPHRGLAVLNPEEYRLRDFIIQQGLLTVYARPFFGPWDVIKEILSKTEENVPIFGYMALTGQEEFAAVSTLSAAGKYLIPSDTTMNLSFHSALRPPHPLSLYAAGEKKANRACRRDRLNVTIAITDGDNLTIPLNRYAWGSFWQTGHRGKLPVGWSFALSLPAVAPAAAAYFLEGRTDNDELVGMLGIGYALSSYYKDPGFFLSRSFAAMRDLGLSTFWTLDVPMYQKRHKGWKAIEAAALPGHPIGVLHGYIAMGEPYFHTRGGLPVLVAASNYEDTPHVLVSRIEKLLALPLEKRPAVVFLSASGWSNPYDELVNILKPLEAQGVNFLLPREAFACLPAPKRPAKGGPHRP